MHVYTVLCIHNYIESEIGCGSFGSCHVRIMSGLPVVIKMVHRQSVKQRHVLQEAHLLQVRNKQANIKCMHACMHNIMYKLHG